MDLARLLRLLWINKWLLIATTIVATALTLVVAQRQPGFYQSNASVTWWMHYDVNAVLGTKMLGVVDAAPRTPADAKRIAESPEVFSRAVEIGGLDITADELDGLVEIEDAPNVWTLTIRSRGDSAEDAQANSQAVARAIVEYANGKRVESLRRLAAGLGKQLEQASAASERQPTVIAELTSSLASVEAALDDPVDVAVISSEAQSGAFVEERPSMPALLIAPILGLALGAGIVVLRQLSIHTVLDSAQLREVTDVPVLAAARPQDAALSLAAVLNTRQTGSGVLLATATASAGGLDSEAALVRSLTELGSRIVLVDATGSGALVSRMGLKAEILGPGIAPADGVVDVNERFRVLATAGTPETMARATQSGGLRPWLSPAFADRDLVLVGAGPLSESASAVAFAPVAPQAVLFVETGVTRLADVSRSLSMLTASGIEPIALLVLEANRR